MRPSAEAVGANRWHRRRSSAMLNVPIWHRRRVKEWEMYGSTLENGGNPSTSRMS